MISDFFYFLLLYSLVIPYFSDICAPILVAYLGEGHNCFIKISITKNRLVLVITFLSFSNICFFTCVKFCFATISSCLLYRNPSRLFSVHSEKRSLHYLFSREIVDRLKQNKTLVWAIRFCFVLVEMKSVTFKDALVVGTSRKRQTFL